VSKGYGAAFLDSLPPCQVREAPLRELAGLTSEWLKAPSEVHATGSEGQA